MTTGTPWRRTLAALLLIFAAGSAPAAQRDADFIDDFVVVALQREYGGANEGRLIKWQKPIRVGLLGEKAAYYLPVVEQHLADLREITGHAIHHVPNGEADVIVAIIPRLHVDEIERYRPLYRPFFKSDEAYERQLSQIRQDSFQAVCLTTLRIQPRESVLSGAIVFIPAERGAAVVWQCIVEELSQLMGLPNDADSNFNSIFNDRSPHVSLTAKDRRMLRLLYDPRLTPGMNEADVRRTAAELLKDWARIGTAK